MNPLRIRLSPPALALLALAACATALTHPRRCPKWRPPPPSGHLEGLLEVAELYERFNDPRAVDWYERAATATPWTFRNPRPKRRWAGSGPTARCTRRRPEHVVPGAARVAAQGRALVPRRRRARQSDGDADACPLRTRTWRRRRALRWDLRATIYHIPPNRRGCRSASRHRTMHCTRSCSTSRGAPRAATPTPRWTWARCTNRDGLGSPAIATRRCGGTGRQACRATCTASTSPACCWAAAARGAARRGRGRRMVRQGRGAAVLPGRRIVLAQADQTAVLDLRLNEAVHTRRAPSSLPAGTRFAQNGRHEYRHVPR